MFANIKCGCSAQSEKKVSNELSVNDDYVEVVSGHNDGDKIIVNRTEISSFSMFGITGSGGMGAMGGMGGMGTLPIS